MGFLLLTNPREGSVMKKNKFAAMGILLTGFLLAPHVFAADNSCRIMGSLQNDVWVIIYDADSDGNRGPIIYKGKVEAGKEVPIKSTDGHIRFDYTLDPNQPYDGDLSRACFGNRTIQVD